MKFRRDSRSAVADGNLYPLRQRKPLNLDRAISIHRCDRVFNEIAKDECEALTTGVDQRQIFQTHGFKLNATWNLHEANGFLDARGDLNLFHANRSQV